jgi:hypothetical protein
MKSAKWEQSIGAAEMLLKIEQAGSIHGEKLISGKNRTRKLTTLFSLFSMRSIVIDENDMVSLTRKPKHEHQGT